VAAASLHEIIHEAADLAAIEARRLGAGIRFDLCVGDPIVEVDRVQIQQVLVNLFKNAFEAMQDCPTDDRIATVRTVASPEHIEVSIADQGAGIIAEHEPRLFEAFFTTKPDGMGMGLAVSRTIIDAHGGTIWARRNADRGAAFHFTLPIQRQ
jgi:two-component system sensor kinase FixL